MEQSSAFNAAQLDHSPVGALPFVGCRAVTLNAAPVGTTDVTVARFDTRVFSNPSGRGPLFDIISDAVHGTLIRPLPGSQGRYSVKARVNTTTAGTVWAGLSIGLPATPAITADPSIAVATTQDVARNLAAGADDGAMSLDTIWEIDGDAANATAGSMDLRLLLSNGAGAGPAAADIVLAQCWIEVRYLGQCA